MKKTILGFITIAALFLGCAEAETIFNQILWTGSCWAVCAICGRAVANLMSKEEKEERV